MKLLGIETKLLATWFNGKKFKLQVVYRATRDGFDAAKFHSLVDNQGPTLTVILSKDGFLFGGFTCKSWVHTGNAFADDQAFIFSLTNKTMQTQYQN